MAAGIQQKSSDSISSIPRIICTSFDKDFTPTCLSNGVIGITPGTNPLVPVMNWINTASTVVGGFVHNHPAFGVEELAPAPYPLGLDLRINGISMREHPDKVKINEQVLSMENGELITSMTFKPSDEIILEIEVLQFASRSVPSVVCQQLTLRSNKELSLEVTTHIDLQGTKLSEYAGQTRILTETTPKGKPNLVDQVKAFETDLKSKLGIALMLPRRPGLSWKEVGNYTVQIKGDQPFEIQELAALVSDLYHPVPHLEAIRLVRWAEMMGFEKLQETNRNIWSELWKSRIKVTGCSTEDQRALDVAFYYFQSNIHSSSRMGYPPFGLTQSWAYYGHNFWDMDVWMMIPTVLVQPEAARSMVEYRYKGLEGARQKAALFGYRGGHFPLEASIHGFEACPSNAATGWAEQHFAMAPGLGAWTYYLATGEDKEYLRETIWPIIKSVAIWIESRGEFTERGFEFKVMMGPDEWINNVNNQSYFNLLAKMVMTFALDCAQQLNVTISGNWKRIADSIYIPMDETQGVVLPYDPKSMVRVFDESKDMYVEVKPKLEDRNYSLGNMHFLFIHGCPIKDEIIHNTYFYEEKIRLARVPEPGVPGSSRAPGFTSPAYMSMAAFFGEREKSADLFVNSWKPYWLAPYGMTREYQSQKYGSYITTFGSLLQNTILGLTGMRITKEDWCKYLATMPEGWKKIEIDQIWIKGKPMKLVAEHGKKTKLTPIKL